MTPPAIPHCAIPERSEVGGVLGIAAAPVGSLTHRRLTRPGSYAYVSSDLANADRPASIAGWVLGFLSRASRS